MSDPRRATLDLFDAVGEDTTEVMDDTCPPRSEKREWVRELRGLAADWEAGADPRHPVHASTGEPLAAVNRRGEDPTLPDEERQLLESLGYLR